jgi:hypothetical protein
MVSLVALVVVVVVQIQEVPQEALVRLGKVMLVAQALVILVLGAAAVVAVELELLE